MLCRTVIRRDFRVGGVNMPVRELQESLSKVDPDLPVVCISEDEELLRDGQLFRLLHIDYTDVSRAGSMTELRI